MRLSANGKRIGRPPVFTPEERAVRDAEKRRERDRARLKTLTDEQRQRRREADARYKASRPITEEMRERQRAATRKSRERRRAEMSPEELAAEKAKKRAYNQSYQRSEQQKKASAVRSSEWARANRERAQASRAARAAENPDAARIYAQNRRARKRSQAGCVSKDIVDRLRVSQRDTCPGCRQPLGDRHELDHIVPLAKGGAHDDRNLQLLCRECNRSKGTKDPVSFMQAKGMLL